MRVSFFTTRKLATELAQKLRERDALQREASCRSRATQKAEMEYAAAKEGDATEPQLLTTGQRGEERGRQRDVQRHT
jgi:hypothetical protein